MDDDCAAAMRSDVRGHRTECLGELRELPQGLLGRWQTSGLATNGQYYHPLRIGRPSTTPVATDRQRNTTGSSDPRNLNRRCTCSSRNSRCCARSSCPTQWSRRKPASTRSPAHMASILAQPPCTCPCACTWKGCGEFKAQLGRKGRGDGGASCGRAVTGEISHHPLRARHLRWFLATAMCWTK